MSRKPRLWFPGATYHITDRGNRHATLFYDDKDRKKYLKLLEETYFLYPFILHSYCFMTNHIHLLLETINHHPKEIMSMLNSRYAIYFNKRHQFDGHVFQGRYKSELIDSGQYFLEASRYIHMNPVKANIVISPQSYPWSSCHFYIPENLTTPLPFFTTDKILSFFPEPQLENYIRFIEQERHEPFILTN